METFLMALGVVSIGGVLLGWVWSAARRAGNAHRSMTGHLAGHEAAGYTAGYYGVTDHGDRGCSSPGDAGCDASG